jgi:hypothetical protein
MKTLFIYCLLLAYKCPAQIFSANDTTAASRPILFGASQNQLIIKDHVVFSSPNIKMSSIELEISDLEEIECKAILKRDTITLIKLWDRDFTLDAPSNELATSKNGLPYYVSFTRIVEHLNVIGDFVYTDGYELLRPLQANLNIGNPIKRNYLHVWSRKSGSWKLISKHSGNQMQQK